MSQRLVQNIAVALTMGVIGYVAGCQSESRPGVTEYNGTYERIVSASNSDVVFEAVERSVGGFGYVITGQEQSSDGVRTLYARDRQANEFHISIYPPQGQSCRVTVRITPGQNEAMSQAVLKSIDREVRSPVRTGTTNP